MNLFTDENLKNMKFSIKTKIKNNTNFNCQDWEKD
jgi:hypothetical protein